MPDGYSYSSGAELPFDAEAARAASALCPSGVAGEEGGEEGREVRGGVGSGVGDEAGMRWGGGGVLRIAPARGSALLFLSVRRDAPTRGLPHMWHGGCRVHRGEKWTLQFFKELPYSTPPPVTLSTA